MSRAHKRNHCLESGLTDEERWGRRDLIYSKWHRPSSGWLGHGITYIDLDACEYCRFCWEPLALLEIARDIGQSEKPTIVTCKLAEKAGLPAYLVFYRIASSGDIDRFRIRLVYNPQGDRGIELIMTPQDYASFLTLLHEEHRCHEGLRQEILRRKGMVE